MTQARVIGADFDEWMGLEPLEADINPAFPWIYLPSSSWHIFYETIRGELLTQDYMCSSMYCYFKDVSCEKVKEDLWHSDSISITLGDMHTSLEIDSLLMPGTILGRDDGETSCFLPIM